MVGVALALGYYANFKMTHFLEQPMVAKHAHVIYHWKGNLPNIRNSTTLVNSLRNITIVLKFIFIINAFREYNSHLQDITS